MSKRKDNFQCPICGSKHYILHEPEKGQREGCWKQKEKQSVYPMMNDQPIPEHMMNAGAYCECRKCSVLFKDPVKFSQIAKDRSEAFKRIRESIHAIEK